MEGEGGRKGKCLSNGPPVLFDILMMEQGSKEARGRGTRGEHEQVMRSSEGLEEKMRSHSGEL